MVLTVGRLIRFGDGDGAVIFLSGLGLGLFDRGGGIPEIGWRDLSRVQQLLTWLTSLCPLRHLNHNSPRECGSSKLFSYARLRRE